MMELLNYLVEFQKNQIRNGCRFRTVPPEQKKKEEKSTVKLDKFQMKEIEKECCANTYANVGDYRPSRDNIADESIYKSNYITQRCKFQQQAS